MVAVFLKTRAIFIHIENHYQLVAGVTGLEPAASCVTGRRSNQTELHPQFYQLMVGGKGLEPMTLSV